MYDPSRFHAMLLTQRSLFANDEAKRDDCIAGTMASAMVEARASGNSGVTRDDLKRCGFEDDELDRLGKRAAATASMMVHGDNRLAA